MTYQTNPADEPASSNPSGFRGRFDRDGDYMWWAKTPGINPLKIVAVIAGFAIFPPLGLGVLAYLIWNARRHAWGAQSLEGHPAQATGSGRGCGRGRGRMSRTGNVAFDDHRAQVLNDLEAEQQAFAEHRAEQRRKQDKEAFDAFQGTRGSKSVTPADEKK
jgi:hypothetical protein